MLTTKASHIKDEGLQHRIESLHLFREIREDSAEQYQVLLELSKVYHVDSGEILLQAGERDRWLYFVLRGVVQVCGDDRGKEVLTELFAGEMFGDLTLLTGHRRSAYVRVPDSSRQVIVIAVDFTHLGDLEKHRVIGLPTKLLAYRQIVHSLRWRNDQYRIRFPGHPVANEPYAEQAYRGEKGSQDELYSLGRQAESLAERLLVMNRELGLPDLGSTSNSQQAAN